MCFTKLLAILDKNSRFHTASFWIAIGTLQLAESGLYPAGLALLEQSLLTLESQGTFDDESVHEVLLGFRKDPRMEWHCKQLDHLIGVSFANNFHFALVAYLLKGKNWGGRDKGFLGKLVKLMDCVGLLASHRIRVERNFRSRICKNGWT